jgi:hypothetical protein
VIDIARVSACIPTRGDVDLTPTIEQLNEAGIDDVVVWDNSRRPNLQVFARFAAVRFALGDVILTMDDDVILPAESILDLLGWYEQGEVVVNMPARFRPHYAEQGHWLVGFGAVFGRNAPNYAWRRYLAAHHADHVPRGGSLAGRWLARFEPTFARTCDVVFTALTPATVMLDLDYVERDFAQGPDRMYRQPEHVAERMAMLERALSARGSVAA